MYKIQKLKINNLPQCAHLHQVSHREIPHPEIKRWSGNPCTRDIPTSILEVSILWIIWIITVHLNFRGIMPEDLTALSRPSHIDVIRSSPKIRHTTCVFTQLSNEPCRSTPWNVRMLLLRAWPVSIKRERACNLLSTVRASKPQTGRILFHRQL